MTRKWLVALLAVGLLVASAPALATTLTFSEFPVGTVITNQYAAQGVLFAGVAGGSPPIIANDGAMPDSPVLSPNPPFAGDFLISSFIGGAVGVQFDSGFWNTVGTGAINVFSPAHVLLAHLTNSVTGVEHFDLSAYGIIGTIFFNSELDPFGADIDNLTFTSVPEPTSLLLLGSGLFGLAGTLRRRFLS